MTLKQIINRDVCWDQVIIPGDTNNPPITLRDNSELFWRCYNGTEDEYKSETEWIFKQLTCPIEKIKIFRKNLESLADSKRRDGLKPTKLTNEEYEGMKGYMKPWSEGDKLWQFSHHHPAFQALDYFEGEVRNPLISEKEARALHCNEYYPGLLEFPLIAQEMSWLDTQFIGSKELIAKKLNVSVDEVEFWLKRRDSECRLLSYRERCLKKLSGDYVLVMETR